VAPLIPVKPAPAAPQGSTQPSAPPPAPAASQGQ